MGSWSVAVCWYCAELLRKCGDVPQVRTVGMEGTRHLRSKQAAFCSLTVRFASTCLCALQSESRVGGSGGALFLTYRKGGEAGVPV